MARSSNALSCLLLLCAGVLLVGQMNFVNPARQTAEPSKMALRAKSPGQPGYGGFGSIYGDTGSVGVSSYSASPAPAVSAPSTSSSSSSGGSIVQDPNTYIIGFTAFFFASVYANANGFFGPW
eukprot:TRINITY_DN1713_c0_g1_i12.p1 TRINITY_DN1713_c0_g1~~TRINITY_DN1713_c0_g1_i12.p1  ORF type:complete len:123 (+),score=25.74 TRINITY_DN1713_c0_g1_i12:221-589(+)